MTDLPLPPRAIRLLGYRANRSRTRFLWPTYTEDASNDHVLLIALIVSIKNREHLPIWGEWTRQWIRT